MPKYVFCTGGVMSGLGKGVTVASMAKLLRLCGFETTCVKIDPYLNVDAGTMNPLIHGEVFVTDDGGEADMDLGTYERFMDVNLTREHNITTGQIYKSVIEKERSGKFLGVCVQIIPHITDEIKSRIRSLTGKTDCDIVFVECGGTVGDIESLPFLEAIRQMRIEEGLSNVAFVHITLAPTQGSSGEQKTKPTQHSVQELRRIGIQPDFIIVRSENKLTEESRRKVALFSSVDLDRVVSNHNVESVYQVPVVLHSQKLVGGLLDKLRLPTADAELSEWRKVADSFVNCKREIRIAVVGKYISLEDSYVSVYHALAHSAAYFGVKAIIDKVDAEEIEREPKGLERLRSNHGVVIPGGFGVRGSEGKILAANYAREKGLPFLGLCFGFQMAVVAFARHVLGLEGANSTELDPETPHAVIDLLPDQSGVTEIGGTMRLGGHDITLVEGTNARSIYGASKIRGRHRHRYELNPSYHEKLEAAGLNVSGFSDQGRRAEVFEVEGHPFYMATQYHPEFMSRPGKPEPIYLAFIRSAITRES